MEREELVAAVKAAGVVGAGGAGFPTHVKLAAASEVVIVNGAECEPLLRVDQTLLHSELDVILSGLEAVVKAVGARRAYLALKAKHKALVRQLHRAAQSLPWLEVAPLPDVYPAGDEHVLVYEVLGRIIPPGGIPLDVGAVVLNVETVYNVQKALQGLPVTHTWLTVTGAVESPVTMRVPLGLSMAEIVTYARPLIDGSQMRIIEGGPLMGRIVSDGREPVTKTTKGLIVVPADHKLVRQQEASVAAAVRRVDEVCCQCTMCTDLCPRHLLGHPLEPHRIMRSLAGGIHPERDIMYTALLCSECGVCDTYACFMGLSPRAVNRAIKQHLSGAARKKYQAPASVHRQRQESLIPTSRLMYRLQLMEWDREAPLACLPQEPEKVRLALKQHVGVPARCQLAVGDAVHTGDLVAAVPDGALGASLHSSISGTITAIDATGVEIQRGDGEKT